MKKFYLTAFLALLVSGMARSTTWKELSIGESFALADARNADIVVARNAVDVAGQQVLFAGYFKTMGMSACMSTIRLNIASEPRRLLRIRSGLPAFRRFPAIGFRGIMRYSI